VTGDAVLIYLEADDEVTSVVRRLRETVGERVVLVAPGRSRATSSVVALRLLTRAAEENGRSLAVVGDPLTRSLAAEAGMETYASVDDARNAVPAAVSVARPRGAAIHVVRGDRLDETAALPPIASAQVDSATETRQVPIAPERSRDGPSSRPRRTAWLTVGLALLALLSVAGAVVAVVLLPSATIAITPASDRVGPIPFDVEILGAERLRGEVEASVSVTATGTYTDQRPATGVIVLFNWNTVSVEVGAGTLVAAGEQAFETAETVVVPQGELTSDGRIQAGEAGVGVVAVASGPAANVPAQAIDTVLSQGTAARLRGFPNNAERLVANPDATSGGADESGTEITQADVDAAVAAAREALATAVAEALGDDSDTGDALYADVPGTTGPAFDGLDDLVGARDRSEAEITGRLAYDALTAGRAEIVRAAEERFAAEATVVPASHELVPGLTRIDIGAARVADGRLVVAVTASGASAPRLDRDDVVALVRGRSAEDARAALASLGAVTVELWPAWVQSVPDIDARIEVRITAQSDAAPSQANGTPGP